MAFKMGIYLNSQYPDHEDPSEAFNQIVGQVDQANDVGLDSVWAGEHHLTPGYHFFPQLTMLSHLAAHSGEMTLGTNLVLLPLHRPVDIAEQVALIDIACGGRFILTVGQGYRREEFAAFGVPYEERLPRMVESIDVLRRLWSEDNVTYESEWFSLEGATVRPGPVQSGGPPIWIGATSDRAIKRAGRLADAFMVSPNTDNAEVRRQVQLFNCARAEAGMAPATETGRMIEVHCHADSDEARRRAAPHLLTKYAAYASWGATSQKAETSQQTSTDNSTTNDSTSDDSTSDEAIYAELARDRFVVGNPDEVIAGLLYQQEEIGITHATMRVSWPGSDPNHTTECLDLLGREVLPALRAR